MKLNWKGQMNIVILFGFLIILVASVGDLFAAEKTPAYSDRHEVTYLPNVKYKGEFIQTRLYYHNPRSAVWRSMSKSDNYRDVVTCFSALVALENTGKWQGHLSADGSCGPLEEPSYFALGNRINYDIALDQDVSSK